MPLNSTRGAGSAKGFGLTAGGNSPIDFDYLVIAGGGAADGPISGGGGAGGVRSSFPGGTKITLKGGNNTVTVGAGGVVPPANPREGGKGVASTVGTITSAGGGVAFARGAVNPGPVNDPANQAIRDGGSGSGLGHRAYDGDEANTGSGNVPPVSPSQGEPGGGSGPNYYAGSGGGGSANAGSAGNASGPGSNAGPGGNGSASNITGSPVTRGGGGGGGGFISGGSSGGSGGGGDGGPSNSDGTPGSVNTGGGGGGGGNNGVTKTTGGSGIIILRCPSARVFTVSPGTNTISTEPGSGDQVATFTVSGTIKCIK
jgi:hypothetical protein